MSARRPLRGPGSETLRLIGYPAVREVLGDLARRSRRPRHVPELLDVGAITRRVVPGPPRRVFCSLGPTGPELCWLIEGWLALLPPAPGARAGGQADWRAAAGLAEAWAAGLLQVLFDGPPSLRGFPDLPGHGDHVQRIATAARNPEVADVGRAVGQNRYS